jgi:hypothetical protein
LIWTYKAVLISIVVENSAISGVDFRHQKFSVKGIIQMNVQFPRKEKPTLDELVHGMRDTWITRVRDGQLYAFHAGSHVLAWARENEADFLTYCKRNSIVGDTHETRVVELMLAADPDGEDSERHPTITRERRAEYGNCIGWFADRELCPEADAGNAVALARQKGRITGIAKEFRDKKDAENPKLKAAKQNGQATRVRRQGAEYTTVSSSPAQVAIGQHPTDLSGLGDAQQEQVPVVLSEDGESPTDREDNPVSLAGELGRELDEAGVGFYSPGDLADFPVVHYLAIKDRPDGQPRLFTITASVEMYRQLAAEIISRHRTSQCLSANMLIRQNHL